MSQSADIRVLPVADELIFSMWPHVVPWLVKGLAAAKTSTLHEIEVGVAAGTDRLWCVFQDEKLVGAFVTAVYRDGGDYLGVYALGGTGLKSWADAIDQAMQTEARRLSLDRIRFAGRQAWSRVLPGLAHRGKIMGHEIWERAV